MRTLSTTLKAIFNRPVLYSFMLVKIGPNKDGHRFQYTSLPFDFHYSNDYLGGDGLVYVNSNGLQSVDPPKLSEVVDKESYKIAFADPQYTMRPYFENGKFTGADIKIVAGYVNEEQLNDGFSIDTMGIYKDAFITVYSGYVDTAQYSITANEETILTIEGSSPMGKLDASRSILTSKAYQNDKFPGDTSYDEVLEGSSKITLLWGKKK
jgi:hypothetical protein